MTTTQTIQKPDDPVAAEPPAAQTVIAAPARKSAAAFRTISEVAGSLGVQQHVLRFWETKFTQIKPLKRGGGRRYYRPEDVALLKRIHTLLYTEGYTIKGVQKLLREQGRAQIVGDAAPAPAVAPKAPAPKEKPAPAAMSAPAPREGLSDRQRAILQSMLGELKELRAIVRAAEDRQG